MAFETVLLPITLVPTVLATALLLFSQETWLVQAGDDLPVAPREVRLLSQKLEQLHFGPSERNDPSVDAELAAVVTEFCALCRSVFDEAVVEQSDIHTQVGFMQM